MNSVQPWLIVAGGFHRVGGMDKANAALAGYLSGQGAPLSLVTYRADPDFDRIAEVHRVRKPGRSFYLANPSFARAAMRAADRFQRQHPRGRVVVNGGNCPWPDVNWVHYVNAAWRPRPDSAPRIFQWKTLLENAANCRRELLALKRARVVIANSERTRRDLEKLPGVAVDKIHVVHLGADSDWKTLTRERREQKRSLLGVSERTPLIVFVGALGYDCRKGFDTLWRAWLRLCSNPQWDGYLAVAGSGRMLDAWKTAAVRSGLGQRVKFLGLVEDVAELLSAADLLVSPARYEAWGLNVQEALCCGVPAMVTRCAGIAEHYPAELRGLLIDNPDDDAALAEHILRWRVDIGGWKRRIRPLQDKLRSRTWDDMADEFVHIAQDAVSTPSHRAEPQFLASGA